MSLLGPIDGGKKLLSGVEKLVAKSKLDNPSTDSNKTGKNSTPDTGPLAVGGRFLAETGQGILDTSRTVNNALFNTTTKENSAIGPDPTPGTCGGAKNRPGDEPGFFERVVTGATTGGTVECGASAVSLSVGAVKQTQGDSGIATNVLNDYLNVQYNVVFSMIPEGKVIKIQESIPLDDDAPRRSLLGSLRSGQAVVFASTGGAFTNENVIVDVDARNEREGRRNNIINGIAPPGTPGAPIPPGVTGSAGDITAQINALRSAPYEPNYQSVDVSDRNYYAIQDLVIDNFQAPTNSNPGVSSMVSAKMTISEPGGFRFNDDIKVIGKTLGYENVNIGRILYRLDVSFSGYDPATGQWVQYIDMDTRKGKRIPFLTYYVTIAKVEAKITNTGTVYEVDLAPSGAGALRTEDFTADAMAIFTGASNTFGGFLKNMEDSLTEKRSQETVDKISRPSGVTRTFEIIAPQALKDAPFYAEAWAVQKTYLKEDDGGALVSAGKDIDIMTAIHAALTDLPFVHELFIAKATEDDNKQFVRPRTHFTVRFNVVYGSPDAEMADYGDMKIQIIIEPFLSFKKGSYSADTVADYTAIGSQIRRVKQMQSLGAIVRKYDYYNTSTNTEVIDFGINLSAFFTESIDSSQDFPGTKGVGVASSSSQQEENLRGSKAAAYSKAVQTQIGTALTGDSDNDSRFETQLRDGTTVGNSSSNGLTPYEVLGGGKSITPDQYSYGGSTSEGAILAARKNRYMREFKDWLANDQQQIDNLQVRGDPLWLLSPYASSDMNRLTQVSPMIRPSTDAVIFINIKAPNQRDYMAPRDYDKNINEQNRNPNVMGGFYGVYRVTSTFSGGGFTQTIQGYKLNHLNYVEEGIIFEDIIGSSLVDKSPVDNITPGVDQLVPDALAPISPLFSDVTGRDITGASAAADNAARPIISTTNVFKKRGGSAF